jgi:hypothetical protein
MSEQDPLKFLGDLPSKPKARQPRRSSGASPQKDPTNAAPARARVRRKPGQEPEVTVAQGTVTLTQPCCPSGHPVTVVMKFCPECGSSVVVAGPPKCRNGHEVAASDKFCATCGTPMQGEGAEKLLTEDEQRAKLQAHRLAMERGKENPVVAYAPGKAPKGVETIVIHFLVDGFSACAQVWMRGQEIEVWPGHPRWPEVQNWIQLDVAGQYARYGRQVFGYGPWPGVKTYTAGVGHFQPLKTVSGEGTVSQPTEEELARADVAEQRRGRRLPLSIG